MALKLTLDIVGQSELNHLDRELTNLNDFFASAKNRESGSNVTPPATTHLLDDLAKLNKLSLLESADRRQLGKQLKELIAKAPKLSIAFAVDPPPRVVQTILNWMRENLNPNILLQVGLQPNIGAGCVIRTPSREFDLSMREHLEDSSKDLASLIQQAAAKLPSQTAASQPSPAATIPAMPIQPLAQPVPRVPQRIDVQTSPPEVK